MKFILTLIGYPLSLWTAFLLFRFFWHLVRCVSALIKKQKRYEKNDWFQEGISLLYPAAITNGIIWFLSDIFSYDKIFIVAAIVISILNTLVDFLLYVWLWRAKGKKFLTGCIVFLFLFFLMYAVSLVQFVLQLYI